MYHLIFFNCVIIVYFYCSFATMFSRSHIRYFWYFTLTFSSEWYCYIWLCTVWSYNSFYTADPCHLTNRLINTHHVPGIWHEEVLSDVSWQQVEQDPLVIQLHLLHVIPLLLSLHTIRQAEVSPHPQAPVCGSKITGR